MGLKIHKDSPMSPPTSSKVTEITVKAFFKRLSFVERKVLRNSTMDEVIDLREDLQRDRVVKLDAELEQQLLDTGLWTQERIDELLSTE